MKLLENNYFWWFGFTLIFLLSLNFWNWNLFGNNFFFSLPIWFFYFIALQIILTASLYLFSINFWKN